MGFEPRTQDTVYTNLRDELKNKISELTNFSESSFNFVWTQAFATQFREAELDKTAAYLDGYVEYAGGPVDESDLESLGIDDVATVDELNDRLKDTNLEELVKIVGISRDAGTAATGTVTFTTQSAATTIPAGTTVTTELNTDEEVLEFTTDSEVSNTSGVTTVDANITASDVGSEYNVGSDTIIRLPNPPSGVQSVTNDNATTGGEDEETNDELRNRAKNAIFQTSGGGTVQGMIGFIEDDDNVSDVTDVNIEEEFTGDSQHGSYPHGHVIVAGGDSLDIRQAIEDSRPVSVQHFLIRPTTYSIGVDIDVIGDDDIDTSDVNTAVDNYIDDLQIADDVIFNKIIQTIFNADDDVVNVDSIDFGAEDEENHLDISTFEDFEDGDIAIENTFWGDWSGDTSSFSSQTSTVLTGSNSGKLASSNANNSVNTTRSSNTTRSFEAEIQIDNQTSNASDAVAFEFEESGGPTTIGLLEFRGNGDVVWTGDTTTVTTWSTGSTLQVTVQWDFANDQADITVDGSTSNDLAFSNSASDWDKLYFKNDTTNSGGSVNAFTDELKEIKTQYTLGLGEEMTDDGITELTGTVGGNDNTFTEDTDYRERDTISGNSTDDTLEWILSGTRPDVNSGQTKTITYDTKVDIYAVDDGLVLDGISDVTDSGGTTYTKGTDWQAFDSDNDGQHDSIEWLDAGDAPDNDTDFTVTYEAVTTSFVDYDLTDDDLTMGDREIANGGNINVTVL